MNDVLFQPLTAGALQMKNRLVMAPMTRSRADDDGNVGELTATYYAQRASAGLIITEGIYPEPMGRGYVRTPGLVTRQHVAGWRRVTDAVHARGGRIVAQLMHVGRISHPSLLPGGATPLAPSAVRPAGERHTDAGPQAHVTPEALTHDGIQAIVGHFADAAGRALEAGFDGVALHGGAGYLAMQFLSPVTNLRNDGYGGNPQNRARFTVEVLEAMSRRIGVDRVGLKLTPGMTFNDMHDPDPVTTCTALLDAIAHLPLAFLDVSPGDAAHDYHALLRPRWDGAYFAGVGLDRETATAAIREGRADAALFGAAFLANPDLPARFRAHAALNAPDADTFYSGGARGYVDYPALAGTTAA